MPMTAPVLSVSDLHVEIGARGRATPILRGVNLTVPAGKILGLVGESGGGKTMVGKAITGLLPDSARITDGSIRFQGHDLVTMPDAARRKLLGINISMILQHPSSALNPVLRIEAQMTEFLQRRIGLDRIAARHRALELLGSVQIRAPERVLRQYPHELSGGICQRIVIAIAFAGKADLIIADEPTTALDVTVQFEILRLLKEFQEEAGVAVLFVTHDLGVVAKICDTVSVIFGGRILEEGPTEQIFARPAHPYTAALIAASPRYDEPEKGLHPVPRELTAQLWRETAEYDEGRKHA
jgi:peptide/nickel transport system ATP-binding protein